MHIILINVYIIIKKNSNNNKKKILCEQRSVTYSNLYGNTTGRNRLHIVYDLKYTKQLNKFN